MAQNNVAWINHYGGQFADNAQHIVTDNNGNIFVCGQFTDSIMVYNNLYVSNGLFDGLLIKSDSTGISYWVKQFKGPKDDQLMRMAWFSSSQLIIAGTFSDSLDLGDYKVYSHGFDDVFIASINPATGNTNWIKTAGSQNGYEFVGGLSCNRREIFCAINYSGPCYIESDIYPCTGTYDFLVARMDSSGSVEHVTSYHGVGINLSSALAVDSSGRAVICGKFDSMLQADTTHVFSNGMFDIFYLSQRRDGALDWIRTSGGASTEVANAINIGHDQDVYMGCWMQDTLTFQDTIMIPDPSGEIFVVKLDYEGNKQWLFRGFPDTGADQISDISINCKGDILFTGLTTYFAGATPELPQQQNIIHTERCAFGDTYVAKLNTQGELVWLKNTLGTNSNLGTGVTADKFGKVYVCGYFTDSLYAGIHRIRGKGGNDMMFFMLNDDEKCFTSPVGVEYISHLNTSMLYPNPSARDVMLFVSGDKETQIVITDMQGNELTRFIARADVRFVSLNSFLPISLSNGIYYVHLQDADGVCVLPWFFLY